MPSNSQLEEEVPETFAALSRYENNNKYLLLISYQYYEYVRQT